MSARYTLVAGTKNWSSWSLRPYVALRATGAPFEEIVIPLRRSESPSTQDEIHKHSAAGRVPVLKIEEEGKTHTVWDSFAICETLAERFPDAKLWPHDAFARARARSYAAEMHSGFAALRSTLSMDFARRIATPALDADTKADIARILTAWEHALAHHGDEGEFLFGHFSIADAMYAPVVSRFLTYGIDVSANVRGYMDRMMALPAMRDWGSAAKREVEEGLA
ncbi:MAG TPA: glutathione S-transferase family protein [Rhizomicrobium sp.]|jgi:glutathione S-transferase|nr:glutathione S-transferase family protein [Rhizomicrobium sp.]